MPFSKYRSLIIPVPDDEEQLNDILNISIMEGYELISVGETVVTNEQGKQEQKLVIVTGKIKASTYYQSNVLQYNKQETQKQVNSNPIFATDLLV